MPYVPDEHDRHDELIALATRKRGVTYALNEKWRHILQALVREGLLTPKRNPPNPVYLAVYTLPPDARVQLTDAGRAYILALNPDDFARDEWYWYPLPQDVRAAQAALSR